MNAEYSRIVKAASFLRERIHTVPKTVLVLGSGLGGFAKNLKLDASFSYSEIDSFVSSTVEGHDGKLLFGTLEGVPVCLMQGRVHLYEGYSPEEVVRPLRTLKELGAETLFLTNAAGGVNFSFHVGDLMLITDHISSFVPSPLRGENIPEFGVRFPDMSQVYDKNLRNCVLNIASEENIALKQGVYLQLPGPQYETPAEIRMCRTLGADAVGMSTAIEAIAARHAGMRVVALSCISNLACGMSPAPLSHEEVKAAGEMVAEKLSTLVKKSVVAFTKL